ncbi:MAG TPA: SBBP repeat-containing protein [Phycisphaerae bacterium]|nr:SBBP repeat-containing protein [Phycisphaerae bacterium]
MQSRRNNLSIMHRAVVPIVLGSAATMILAVLAACNARRSQELQAESPVKTARIERDPSHAFESNKTPTAHLFDGQPMRFEENRGQAPEGYPFRARGRGYTMLLSPTEVVLGLQRNADGAAVHMKFVGSRSTAELTGVDELPGKVNYFIGNDPANWRTEIPTYARVRCEGVWPGIDVEYYGNQRQLEFDFVVAPGVDPSAIEMRFNGADRLNIDVDGALQVTVASGEVVVRKPLIYQEIDGQRRAIAGGFVLRDNQCVAFHVDRYEPTLALVIDPVVVYSTYLGGAAPSNTGAATYDEAFGVAVDSTGAAYVVGTTHCTDFPTLGAFDNTVSGPGDAFVTKFSATGTLVYSTYLGGTFSSASDQGYAIAVDSSGSAYMTGSTFGGFPATAGAFDTSHNGSTDVFVTKLSPSGSALVYSTFLGGPNGDQGNDIVVNSSGEAHVVGAPSSGFPTTPGAFDTTLGGTGDAFVAKLNAAGSALVFSTFLGGSGADEAQGVALDSAGAVYVTGSTHSSNFPVTAGVVQSTIGGSGDAFVTKFNPTGSSLVYSTYFGGSGNLDECNALQVDGGENAYICGLTNSTDLFLGSPGFDKTRAGNDAFVAKLNSTATEVTFCSYLGGSSSDETNAIALDVLGRVYVAGTTSSGNTTGGTSNPSSFPTTSGALKPIKPGTGPSDAFLSIFESSGTSLAYSSFLGGSTNSEFGNDLAVLDCDVWVVGRTLSSNFPLANAFDGTFGGAGTSGTAGDAFVTRMNILSCNRPPTATCPAPIAQECASPGGNTVTLSTTVGDADGDALTVIWKVDSVVVQTDNVPSGGAITTATLTLTQTFTLGNHTVEVIAVDSGAVPAECHELHVMIVDTEGPTVVCPVELEAESADEFCQAAIPDVTGEVNVNDDCTPTGSITVTQSPAAGTLVGLGTHSITVSATDGSNNSSTCNVSFVVSDTTGPQVVDCPSGGSASADAACQAIVPDYTGGVLATDNCSAAAALTIQQDPVPGAVVTLGLNEVLLTVTDAAGNASVCVVQFEVTDDTSPVLALPANATVQCDQSNDAGAMGSATAVDNCDAAPAVSSSDEIVPGDCPGEYTIVRTWNVLDATGNSASDDQIIDVIDSMAPVLAGVPSDATAECDAVPAAAGVTANDNCDPAPSVASGEDVTPGDCAGNYILTRSWTATDACGNASFAEQHITVVDNTAPEVSPPADVTVECGQSTDVSATGPATAVDSCDASPAVSSSDSVSGACPQILTRSWSASDGCGNATAPYAQTITVVDNTAPTLSLATTSVTVIDMDNNGSEPVTLPAASAADTCDPNPAITYAPALSTFPVGTTLVTVAARDACGNESTETVEVTVQPGGPGPCATLVVEAARHSTGSGPHPTASKSPLVGILVGVYDKSEGSCARSQPGPGDGITWQKYPAIVANCAPVASQPTNSEGIASFSLPAGDYVVISHFDSDAPPDGVRDQYIGVSASDLACGQTMKKHLQMLVDAQGVKKPGKTTRLTGSELLIIEPEYVVWDNTVQLYPFVLESIGDWCITASVAPPEGFIADYSALSATVNNQLGAVQFTITEVGSDLVPTRTEFQVMHNGRSRTVSSDVGIMLTPTYARSRGFDVGELRRRGLIVDRSLRPNRTESGNGQGSAR